MYGKAKKLRAMRVMVHKASRTDFQANLEKLGTKVP